MLLTTEGQELLDSLMLEWRGQPSLHWRRRRRGLRFVGMGPFVAAQIRELRIGLGTVLTGERLNTGVDMLMLLQAARGRECFSTLRANVPSVSALRS